MMFVLFIILISVFCLQLLLALAVIYSSKSQTNRSKGLIDNISVIIPFRNEKERISELLESLNSVNFPKELKVQFIFVDDHSEDSTADVIQAELKIPHEIIKAQNIGKKAAIHEAVQQSSYDYILTLDADIKLPKNYFFKIQNLPQANMWVLPVELEGNSFFSKLSTIDFSWIQLLTRALVNTGNPVLANGANLMFSKLHYHVAHEIRDDMHIASGDDLFLLAAFRDRGFRIITTDDKELTVLSKTANSWNQLLQQRKRWAMKMSRLISREVIMLGGFLFLSQLAFVTAIFLSFFNIWFLIPIAVKWLSEFLMTVFSKNKVVAEDFPIVLIHQLWFPLYMITVFLWPVPGENRWVRK